MASASGVVSPMEIQVSVYRTSASMQAFSGSWDAMILEPFSSAILVAFHMISALGILTAGQQATMSIPMMAAA